MKKLILLSLVLLSSSAFSSKCSDHFDVGEKHYLDAVDMNHTGNTLAKEAKQFFREGEIGAGCGRCTEAAGYYQVTLELMLLARKEMYPASRNCFRRRDRERAKDNLALLKSSSAKVKGNLDRLINIYRSYCE